MLSNKLKAAGLALSLVLWAGQASAVPILFDVNSGGSVTQAGATATDMSNINDVTFSAFGNVRLDNRDRGNANTDGAGGDTANNDLWRDFIFADNRPFDNTSADSGIDINIAGLLANTRYDVRLWAFDDSSNGGRNMLWNDVALNIPSNGDPTSLDDQMVSFQAISDATGTLLLTGRVGANTDACCNVFVNGFELTVVPEPGSLALLGLGLMGLGFARRKSA